MVLKLYNTLTRSKEDFVPIDPANVRMYVCGPTVYDYAHIGNARPVIVFDLLYRLLRHEYGVEHVKYVRNITDVDDKINARAAERGISIRELTERTAKIFEEDVGALGCLPPDVQPRATEHIAEMIAITQKLIDSGHAYAADGHVLFSVPSMPDYGRLSRRTLDEMIAGARVDVAPYKRGDMDFVLWKPSKPEEPGWDSPWGRGRPGWHIECSAMSWKHLGETFDIHGGGIDLMFPHHENEIAQSTCAFGHEIMANVWMHNGFLQVEGQKMSKSLGNFVTIRELLHKNIGDVLRMNMLKTHYRQPIDWRERDLLMTRSELGKWSELISNNLMWRLKPGAPDRDFITALEDDLNTPAAFARLRQLFELAETNDEAAMGFMGALEFLGLKHIKKHAAYNSAVAGYGNLSNDVMYAAWVYKHLELNGLIDEATNIRKLNRTSEIDFKVDESGSVVFFGREAEENESRIASLIATRSAARATKNWAESDRIRDELAAQGIVLKDNKDGTTTWEVKR